MPLTRLDNLISSKTGKYLYVSPDDFNASDALDNRGNSPLRPFVSIQRAFLEAARFSYLPNVDNDRFDQFTIMLAPGNHYIDNRPGISDVASLPVFQFNQSTNEWEANSNVSFNLSDPDNILYKFNGRDGGATIPRGTSLVGTDLRRTQVRALYVPDPADTDVPRTSLFNVTGGCYFWQFTILDGDFSSGSPLYDATSAVGRVYTQPNNSTNKAIPEFSHHKITNFVFADREDLGLLYRKIARVFSDYQPTIDDVYVEGSVNPVTDAWLSTVTYQIGDRILYNGDAYIASASSTNVLPDSDETKWGRLVIRGRELDFRVQENRIVGPLQDAIRIDSLKIQDSVPVGVVTVTARTKINHGLFPGQFVAVTNNGLSINLNGVFKVATISQTDPKEFTYTVPTTASGLGLISGAVYNAVSSPALDTNATIQSEIDSVESASPYVFNVSIRSVWGICGIWADGRKATGFKSMVIAQYTGVSLQKDDRAFIRYDEFSNTWNQAPLTDAFATTPYHIKGDAYWKDEWRNFHVRASDDSFIQNVSIFAVGFADHFLLESGGDMSITNSNSNFGNTSMHSKGFKGFAFNQDKGGYITDIIPPQTLSTLNISKQQYYSIDALLTRSTTNNPSTSKSKLYIASEDARNPENRPAASIAGYRLGARRNEKLYVKLDTTGAKFGELNPSGFKKWTSRLTTLTPTSARSSEDATKLYVASSTGFAVNNIVRVDNEYFLVTAVTPTYLSVSRAQLNSLPATHTASTAVVKYVQNTTVSTVVNETVDATETILTLTSSAGFAANGYVQISNNQTSITEIVRVISVESNDIVVQRAALGTTAVSQPVSSVVTATFLSNTFSAASPAVSTTLTQAYPQLISATNTLSETDYNLAQDAANLIDSNKAFIQAEAFGYVLEKYPFLQNLPYVNPNITAETGRYRDGSNLIKANRQEIIDYAFAQMQAAFPTFTVPGVNGNDKCKRDIGLVVDAISQDLYDGGNSHTVDATKLYFDSNGALISNGLLGEEIQSVYAFNRARDWAKKAISNLLTSTSLLSVSSITASGTTITVTTSTPHNLTNGSTITVGGATQSGYNGNFTVLAAGLTSTQFRYTALTTPAASPATGAYYVSTIIIDPVNDDVTVGRFKDAYNLINLNRQEIIDRAFAEIAIQYDEAAWGNNWIVPGDTVTTNLSRYLDAYRLIQKNKQILIETAYATVVASPPSPAPTDLLNKCKRDIGLFIDSVSLDIFLGGGNKYTRKFIQQYFSNNTTLLTNGLAGEITQSITAFNKARDAMKSAVTNTLAAFSGVVTSSPAGGTWQDGTTGTKVVYTDLTISSGPATFGGGGGNIANNNAAACSDVRSAIDTLASLVQTTLTASPLDLSAMTAESNGIAEGPGELKCMRDIGIIVDSVAQDLFWGGNEFTVGGVREYFNLAGTPISNGLVGETLQSVIAFNAARDVVNKAVTNQLYGKNLNISYGPATVGGSGGNVTYTQSGNSATCIDVQNAVTNLFAVVTDVVSAGTLNNLPLVDNGDSDCANVRQSIDSLVGILTTALANGNLTNLPNRNEGTWSQIGENSKCKRDIGYVVEAITSDLRLGGNVSAINAAESYYTAVPSGYVLDYIENERPQTIDAFNYVRSLAISAMRNHNTFINNASTTNGSPIVTVASTIGLAVGMRVRSVDAIPTSSTSTYNFTATIPSTAYIKKIGDGTNGLATNQIQLGVQGSKFDSGTTVNATSTSSTVKLYVELTQGAWANPEVAPVVDTAVIQDYNYLAAGDASTGAPGGECASVANTIVNLTNVISTVLNNGVGSVPRTYSSLNTGSLAQRATLFTLTENDSSGNPTTNPHDLETGTAIRLVPRAKTGVLVDKRLIRLPKGFDTNTIYYVIAPGRKTDPFDYSNSVGFNGANQQTLMLATSVENAAAGIYIYSSETDNVDGNVEVDVYQYVLDTSYDLHKYQTTIANGSSEILETAAPHIFDKPANNVTPQKVFFRVASDITGSSLPTLSSTFGGTTISSKVEYFVRYVSSKRFKIYETFANARDDISPVTFQPGSTAVFYTFANKKRSPMRFDASVGSTAISDNGCWFINTLSSNNQIIPVLQTSGIGWESRARTTDTYFERVEDSRAKEDRIYRLRYVIPKNLKTVRDPLRGFVLKIRTDEKRRLLPQKILLKPTAAGASLATINAPLTGERLGLTFAELQALNPNYDTTTYDPSPFGNPKRIETTSKVAFTIQSARKKRIAGKDYLELKVFDIGIDSEAYKTQLFTTVRISSPQGGNGSFVASIPNIQTGNPNAINKITWSGNSKGTAYVHSYFAYENDYYLILKDFTGNSEVAYNENVATTFTQGSVTATLLDSPNGGRSDIKNYLYVVEGANVYTMTVGDTINDDNGVSYTIADVEDSEEMESTFYIFDINTIRRRIAGQQDGVYYLTCLRGDIRPYPTGSGVGENFRNFRFSQPVSKLYPEFYKNDPEWYKGIDPSTATLIDPPPTISAADNYVHGLVTVSDSKGSVTKETVLDFISDPGSGVYTFSGTTAIQAKTGGASAGSEARKITISGNSPYPTENKLFVELRRPSIARSGNHTFEYLGFGPGNYSTGFPVRQEIVLTDTQDFYAQAKREDAGIVFYTGLNSNGDLYIGNRKINAITGEETFLERAVLTESEDTTDSIGTLVTTFDTAVTFNNIITVNGDGGDMESFFNSPVVINNATSFGAVENYPSLKIITGEGTSVGYDAKLENNIAGQKTGDIVIHQNKISSAIFDFNPRGTQDYTLRVALSNRTPDFLNTFGATTGGPTQLQNTDFGTRDPLKSGDIQFKGAQTLFTGSLGWVYANDYIQITNVSGTGTTPQIVGIQGAASGTIVRLNWNTGVTNTNVGITTGSQIRITGAVGALAVVNGVWPVYSSTSQPFNASNNFVDIAITANLPIYNIGLNSGKGYPVDQIAQPSIDISRSIAAFKEVGVIGAEALRTETATVGDYKLGINTVARSAHSAYQTAFVSSETTPRANLDVVGTAFISGKKINSYLTETGTTKTQTNQDNALLVGGDSATPNDAATLRVMTTNSGRVGINATNAQLDRSLVIIGDGRVTGDFKFESDIEVNGGDITTTTTSGTFNFVNNTTFTGTLNIGNWPTTANLVARAAALNIANITTSTQTINIGNATTNQTLAIGTAATTATLNIHTAATASTINIGTVASSTTNTSNIIIGGAFANSAGSRLTIRNANVQIDGDLEVNGGDLKSTAATFNLLDISGAVSTLNFARFASTINMGAVSGTTTIRNALTVNSKITDFGDFTLIGGLRSAAVLATRGSLNTTASFHNVGSLSNSNVDFYEFIDNIDGNMAIVSVSSSAINVVDNWLNNNDKVVFSSLANVTGISNGVVYYVVNRTSTSFQVQTAPSGSIGISPLTLVTTGTVSGFASLYYTALDGQGGASINSSVTSIAVKNPKGLNQFDYILIDSEMMRISTPPAATAPYTFTVERAVDGTTAATHTDDTAVYKLNKTTGATFIDPGPIPAADVTTNVTAIDTVSNFFTKAGTTGIFNGQTVKFTSIGSITGINTTANYFLANVSASGSNQIFQLSSTYPTLNVIDIGGSLGTTPVFVVDDNFINLSEFGGSLKANDFLRIDNNELVRVTSVSNADPQGLFITDGGSPTQLTTFSVQSTTGNTIIGNPNISGTFGTGTLTVYDTITFSGNSAIDSTAQRLVVTNGTTTETFSVRSADGLTNIAGALTVNNNFSITNGGTTFFSVASTTGNTVIGNGNSGTLRVESNAGSTSTSTGALVVDGGVGIGENLYVAGDAFIQGGDLTVSSSGTTRFKVNNNGSIDLGNITNFYTPTGGRKWLFISTASNNDATAPTLVANTNYIIKPSGTATNLILKLPPNAQTGDMIRIVDVGGNLTFNCTLIIRAPGGTSGTGIKIQGDNTGSTAGSLSVAHTGGELIIQTPNCGFGLVYVGDTDGAGTTTDTDARGWWLMEI